MAASVIPILILIDLPSWTFAVIGAVEMALIILEERLREKK